MKCLLFYNQQSFITLLFNFASITFEMYHLNLDMYLKHTV